MGEEINSGEVLFKVGDREIRRNSLYAIIGPSNTRQMAVEYDPETNKSTWVEPLRKTFTSGGDGLMAVVVNASLFEDSFDTSEPYLGFKGGFIEFDKGYRPTPEQIEKLINWYAELEKADISGLAPEPSSLKNKP
tara:strand:+ start:124 stop:528 length:405 start_codon:yes stop_codon:yes gene_type:complete